MADLMYHNAFYQMMLAAIDLTQTTGTQLKLALMATGHSASTVDDAGWSDVSANELTGSGYAATGKDITKGAMTPSDDDANDVAVFDITEDVTWAASTISGYYAVLYDDTHASDALLCSFDFGGVKNSSGGDFTVQFDTGPPAAAFTVG